VVIAVVRSIRSRADTGLMLVLGAIALIYAAGIAWIGPLVADPTDFLPTRRWASLGTTFALQAGVSRFAYSGLATVVTAARARRWAWCAALVAALLPMVALALVGGFPITPSSYAANMLPFTATLFCPIVAGMAFALSQRPGQAYAA